MRTSHLASTLGILAIVALVFLGSGLLYRQQGAPRDQMLSAASPLTPTPVPGYPAPGTPLPAASPSPTRDPRLTGRLYAAPGAIVTMTGIPTPRIQLRPDTPTPAPLTPTWQPFPSPTPYVVPTNVAKPSDYPPAVPRKASVILSGSDSWSIARAVQASDLVVRAHVVRIDPPYWHPTQVNDLPRDLLAQTPAVLQATLYYKGSGPQLIDVVTPGGCFGPNECTGFVDGFRWQDVVGYDLILMLGRTKNEHFDGYYPARTYIVHPFRDEAIFPTRGVRRVVVVSKLEAEIRAAPTANPKA